MRWSLGIQRDRISSNQVSWFGDSASPLWCCSLRRVAAYFPFYSEFNDSLGRTDIFRVLTVDRYKCSFPRHFICCWFPLCKPDLRFNLLDLLFNFPRHFLRYCLIEEIFHWITIPRHFCSRCVKVQSRATFVFAFRLGLHDQEISIIILLWTFTLLFIL